MSTDEDLILISSDAIIIRMLIEEIRVCRRPSKGVRVMRLLDGVKIVSIASAALVEEEEVSHTEDDGSADEGAEAAAEESVDETPAE